MRKGKIYCPANGWDCPYYKNGECGLDNPMIFPVSGMQMMITSAKTNREPHLKTALN